MIFELLILIVGLALVIFGADWLVDGSSAIARKAGVSEFVIGLTIVGFGTSCPELVVSLTGALKGIADISIGNVVGSNIFNIFLILGVTAILSPVAISRSNKWRDIPLTFSATLLLIVFGLTHNTLSRIEGIFLLLLFIAYIYYCFKSDSTDIEKNDDKHLKLFTAAALVVAGLSGLILGGRLFVESATEIAKIAGVSDKFIAITILAGGTSLPELATCIVAASKKKDQLALGNILGSNVFNILLILGASSIVTPLNFASINYVDIGALVLSVVLLFVGCYTGRKNCLDRFDGVLLLLCEAAYMTWLIIEL